MTAHTFHPDSHEHGLADDCPRCEEHAAHPFESLDNANLRALVQRVERDLPARSEAEAIAMLRVAEVRAQSKRFVL